MNILGIDTSCDDSSAAIVKDGRYICSNIIASQHNFHERFGGIVPAIAARQHVRVINHVIYTALDEAHMHFHDLDAVAVTSDQGLALSLVCGVAAAKSIALACNIPLIGMHHLEGHIYSGMLAYPDDIIFPFLCVTAAGGHTMLIKATDHSEYHLLGHTRDDAAGEAYDKIARRLGLGYPGGPIIDRMARQGNPKAFAFPRPMLHDDSCDFSFSGLKTAVQNTIEAIEAEGKTLPIADICASFQQAVVDMLTGKTIQAIQKENIHIVTLAGGVAANQQFREAIARAGTENDFSVYIPEMSLCVDNGAMIAGAAYPMWLRGRRNDFTLDVHANAPLGSLGIRYKPASKYE